MQRNTTIVTVSLMSRKIFGRLPAKRCFKAILNIADGEAVWGVNLLYIRVIVVLFAAGTLIFNKKRLPL